MCKLCGITQSRNILDVVGQAPWRIKFTQAFIVQRDVQFTVATFPLLLVEQGSELFLPPHVVSLRRRDRACHVAQSHRLCGKACVVQRLFLWLAPLRSLQKGRRGAVARTTVAQATASIA